MMTPLSMHKLPGILFRRRLFGHLRLGVVLGCVAIFNGCDSPSNVSEGQGSKPDTSAEIARDALEEKDGLWHLKGAQRPFTGTAVKRFSRGTIAVSQQFKDGKLEGMEEEWLRDGTKKRETLYRDGKEYFQSVWRTDGSKKIETGMKDGMPHGPHKRWHANGKLGFVGEFYEGQFHGLQVDHDENGVLLMKARYEKGQLVEDLMPPKQ